MNDTSKKNYRIWRCTPESDASVAISEKAAYLIGNRSNYVSADETGVSLNGPISFNCLSEQIRHAGLFSEQNDIINMLPSTIVTPIPQRMPFPPLGFAVSIMKDLPAFLAALA